MPPILKVLELSTAHVSPDTATLLDRGAPVGTTYYELVCGAGWLLLVPESDEALDNESLTKDIASIITYARGHGCRWVLFDGDADKVADLPTWEW